MPRHMGLTNNQLKIVAMTAMLMDHVGLMLLPEINILRVLGRLAFPIFAYMIAEGCRYTKNRRRYLLCMVGMALGIQMVYFITQKSLYQNILVTFSLAVLTVFALDEFIKKRTALSLSLMIAVLSGVLFVSLIAPLLWESQGFVIDYGFFGVLLPVLVYYMPGKWSKLSATAIILLIRGLLYGELKWFALLAIPLLMLYNGERGKAKLKYLFYIFYPAHLIVIYAISLL